MKTNVTVILLFAAIAIGSQNLRGCEPGGSTKKHGGFGDKGSGAFIPGPVARLPASPNPAAYAAVAQYRNALAAQSAAYIAARKPLKLAKAYEMRQATLAARESNRARILAKQEERLRASRPQEVLPPAKNSSPVYIARLATDLRSTRP